MIVVIFILLLGLLIMVHELGHFIVARLAGIKVEEFAFGFPPRVLSVKKGETRYCLNLIPLGGYVKLLGENGESKDHRSFAAKPVLSRLAVVVAGVLMNILLAIVLLTIGYKIGMTPLLADADKLGGHQDPIVVVGSVLEGSAADKAGFEPGYEISNIIYQDKSFEINSAADLSKFTQEHKGQSVRIVYRFENQSQSKDVTLSQGDVPLGVGLAESTLVKLPLLSALRAAVIETWQGVVAIFTFLGKAIGSLFTQTKVEGDLTGPVGIYNLTAQAVKLGPTFLIQLAAILSINLAIINILPVPALDGGRGLFIVLEGLFRRRVVREQIEGVIHSIGFIILLLILLAITVRDIIRL